MNILARIQRYSLVITIVIILGFGSNLYNGTCYELINNRIAGTWYVVFFSLLTAMLFKKYPVIPIILIVLITTVILEFTQLISNSFLEKLREYYIVRGLIGNSFNWKDIPFYFLGTLISLISIHFLEKKRRLI